MDNTTFFTPLNLLADDGLPFFGPKHNVDVGESIPTSRSHSPSPSSPNRTADLERALKLPLFLGLNGVDGSEYEEENDDDDDEDDVAGGENEEAPIFLEATLGKIELKNLEFLECLRSRGVALGLYWYDGGGVSGGGGLALSGCLGVPG